LNEELHITMDTLIAKYLLQEANDNEIAAVRTWMAQSEENEKYVTHFKLLWEESKKIAANHTTDEEAAWQRFKTKLETPSTTTKLVPMRSEFNALRIAAAIFIFILGGWLFKYMLIDKNSPKEMVVKTQKNIIIDTLPDNSTVTLNKNSSISYTTAFTKGSKRNITLTGEAFFSVTPDKNKPFVIVVNDVEVKVVGTSFNIKAVNGQTEVIVKTGVVQVTKRDKTIMLTPQEKLITNTFETNLTKQVTQDKLFNYYASKEFVCEETPLWRLVQVLQEAYDTPIEIGRKELANLPITTTFANESLDVILQVIATTFDIKVVRANGNIILQ
jgi:transmembrane sensor